jgi:integrase
MAHHNYPTHLQEDSSLMAHIQKRPGAPKPYEVRYRIRKDGKTVFRQQSFRSAADAKAFKAQIDAEAAHGSASLPDIALARQPFGPYAERWVARLRVKDRTRQGYEQLLKTHVLPVFGEVPIGSITASDVEDYVAGLMAKKLHPSTVRHAFTPVHRVLRQAVRDRAIRYNPADGVTLPNLASENRLPFKGVHLTDDEVERLATVLDEQPPYGLLIRFMAYTGLRAGEVAGLNVADVKLGRIAVHRTRSKVKGDWAESTPKSAKSNREVPLPPWLREDLAHYLAEVHRDPRPDAPLWPGRHRYPDLLTLGPLDWSEPWERDCFYKSVYKPALAAAGLPKAVRLHDLRHTYASLSLSAGMPPDRVAQRMGHADLGTLYKVYAHLFTHDDDADMELLRRPVAGRARVEVRQLR